ncbi:YolD-like family protein [Paenibacillus sp. GSMTC-2017]|uniref:YolD-like family protein n=1 Tax=Paenibacillus sp. GSMTC-2017 TaxID=2794350 RepID=UPI0018D70896|nr:YolD-like family protein [Paenibacillus sp. GSMTC-2017]MBH5316737.1 YolD-like family protein [Paenibacillus sp. GSMTC-2017]
MRKKLEGNGLWESSRMMLPEHKAAINSQVESLKRRSRIELDEQEWEHVSRAVSESLLRRQQIKVRMFHPIELLTIIGIVDRVDELKGRFMVDGEWFPIRDIEGAALEEYL